MANRRIVKSIEDVSSEVLAALAEKYPDGWKYHVIKVPKPNGEFFHAVTVDHNDVTYLLKVKVKVDSLQDLEKEEETEEKFDTIESEQDKPDDLPDDSESFDD